MTTATHAILEVRPRGELEPTVRRSFVASALQTTIWTALIGLWGALFVWLSTPVPPAPVDPVWTMFRESCGDITPCTWANENDTASCTAETVSPPTAGGRRFLVTRCAEELP